MQLPLVFVILFADLFYQHIDAELNKAFENYIWQNAILLYNRACKMKCSSIGKPENHKGCLCNQAADTREAVYKAYEGQFGRAYGFWIPVEGAEEYIIHFGVGSTFEYPM